MAEKPEAAAPLLAHGAEQLSLVTVDAYNAEMRSADGFVGDRASKRAFQAILSDWRDRLRRAGEDPLGDTPTDEIGRKQLDKLLSEGDSEAGGLVHAAIEEFAQEFAAAIRRFLRLKEWKKTERIVVGGGMRESRIGELAIGRTAVLLKADGHEIELRPIRNDPDHAALIGALHLVPAWMLAGHDAVLAVDIGGTNIRAGLVELRTKKASDFSEATVNRLELWKHSDDEPTREEAVDELIGMLERLIKRADKEDLELAPFIGVACPGVIHPDGSIDRGGQNLPGNWESRSFNLPEQLREAIPTIGDHEVCVVMHNDAVLHGLSELPFMQDVEHWGVLTIGTGLGNAHFTNRPRVNRNQ
ncbi:MAG TPA: ROK family protein [Steroidobacteraceae bacterium]